MNKDSDKIIKRLLKISQMILDEFEVMASLSYRDLENTSQFSEHIEDTKEYLNTEAVIINNIDLNTLKEIFQKLSNYDDDSPAYERTYLIIDSIIERLQYEDDTDTDEDIDDEEYLDIDESTESNCNFIQKYYLDTGDLEKYEVMVIDNIAINTLRKMTDRIMNTYADNKSDQKFKKRLLKNLKTFKYIVLGLDLNLEKLGVNYRFNLESIPYIEKPNIDTSTISYNQCIIHLEKLYNATKDENSLSDINENLFNMMCLEGFLEDVEDDKLDRLNDLCDELEKHSAYHFYGNIAKEKILKKRKN